ncbi:isoamylase early set domain-containing protein [Planctomycetota bacterium]
MITKGKKNEVTFVFKPNFKAMTAYLAGSFNHWKTSELPMTKKKDGSFKKKMTLPAGRHEYKFIVDGIWMNDPEAPENIVNRYGTHNSVVQV